MKAFLLRMQTLNGDCRRGRFDIVLLSTAYADVEPAPTRYGAPLVVLSTAYADVEHLQGCRGTGMERSFYCVCRR